MKTACKPTEAPQHIAPAALSVNIDIDTLVEVVRRHVDHQELIACTGAR